MAMSELARVEHGGLVTTFDEAARAAKAMAMSGYFTDAKQASQAMVKILAGVEMGFGPFASMTGINIIKGKPSVGANLMAAAVKGHPRYDYKIATLTAELCELDFFEDGKLVGRSDFTIAEARAAGVGSLKPPGKPGTMLDMHPRNMLFARAMSNGVRWYCPDAFAGNAVYTPEELTGEIVEGAVVEIKPQTTEEVASDSDGTDVEGGSEEEPDTQDTDSDAWDREEQIAQLTSSDGTQLSADLPLDAPVTSWSQFKDYTVAALGYDNGNHLVGALRTERGTGKEDIFWKGARPMIVAGLDELLDGDACRVIWQLAYEHKQA